MGTGWYLLDHPNTIQQYRTPRRSTLSGMVGVHTTEGPLDAIAPDTGAENVANFIVTRSDYGSYHCIVDTDSVVKMAPDEYETWHIAADAHNWHSWGISAACRADEWDPDAEWTKKIISSMGAEIAAFWKRQGFIDLALNPRWISRAAAIRHEPGLILHGDAQPEDRSDAWKYHPERGRLDQMLLDAIKLAANGGSLPTGGLTVAEVSDILKAIAETNKKLDDALATTGVWEKQTRDFEGLVPIKLPNNPQQYIVTYAPGRGWVKILLSAEAKAILKKQGNIQVNPGPTLEGDFVTLTEPAHINWVNSLPIA